MPDIILGTGEIGVNHTDKTSCSHWVCQLVKHSIQLKKKHLPLVINNGLENQIQLLTYPSAIVEVSILFFLDYLCVI